MRICGLTLSILYAALMIFSILKAKLTGLPTLFIIVGCLLIISYSILAISHKSNFIVILIMGMIGISVGTFLNGVKQNNLHIHHHIIRFIAEAVVTLICWINV